MSLISNNCCQIISSFDGEIFEPAESSKCIHAKTLGLANYRGKALTTGSFSKSSCYVRTEVYDLNTNQWFDAPNYPFDR